MRVEPLDQAKHLGEVAVVFAVGMVKSIFHSFDYFCRRQKSYLLLSRLFESWSLRRRGKSRLWWSWSSSETPLHFCGAEALFESERRGSMYIHFLAVQ